MCSLGRIGLSSGRESATRPMIAPKEWQMKETRWHDEVMFSARMKSTTSFASPAPSLSNEACAVCCSFVLEPDGREGKGREGKVR